MTGMLGGGSSPNLADLVATTAAADPGKTAFRHRDRQLTWGQLDREVDRIAAGLGEALQTGDRVGLLLPNSLEFVATYFGVLRAGLVALPLNVTYTGEELAHQLGDSQARALITDSAHGGIIMSIRDRLPALHQVAVVTDPVPEGAVALADLFVRVPVKRAGGGEDLAVLLYTSGTTGQPKGAMLTHRALLANLDQLFQITPPVVSSTDVVLLALPLFHVYGLNAGLGMVVKAGATGVLVDRFDPVDTAELVRRHRVTNVVGAPPMFVAWSMLPDIADAFGTVRLAVSGAAPLPPEVLEAMLSAGYDVFEGYGLTESGPVLTTTLVTGHPKPGSIGRPIPEVELRLLDEAGHVVEEGDPGEIVVRGPNLFSGYWPDGCGGPDEQGWFGTGDVAYADIDGDLCLVDRRVELILVSGFNVYPREVEDVLLTHPGVQEAAVIGISHPYTGESVKALVVPRQGVVLTADEVIEHAAQRLARFKCPTSVQFLDALPHSATGKVAKGRLRQAEPDSP